MRVTPTVPPDWQKDERSDQRRRFIWGIRKNLILIGGCLSLPVLLLVGLMGFLSFGSLPQVFFPAKELCKLAERAARKDPAVRDQLGRMIKIRRLISGSRSARTDEPDSAMCTATLRGTDATLHAEGLYLDGRYHLDQLKIELHDPERTLDVSLSE